MKDTMETFERAPVPQAVLKNAIPAMAAMLMVLIYNLADTLLEAEGLAWAQPVADLLSTALVAALYLRTSRSMMAPAEPLEGGDGAASPLRA